MEVVKKTQPKKFKKTGYCKVRHIIDCTAIFIETLSDPVIRASTWSDYKHHNTAKILVSISPNRAFNFILEAWGGRTSDVNLTRESEFYNILEPHDVVMADRGFTLAEDLCFTELTFLFRQRNVVKNSSRVQFKSRKSSGPSLFSLGPPLIPFESLFDKTLATPVIKFMLMSNKTSVMSVGSNFFINNLMNVFYF